jgi:predicted ATPase
MLVTLDRCEHVIAAIEHLAEEFRKGAPGVDIPATSRERLRADEECGERLRAPDAAAGTGPKASAARTFGARSSSSPS